MTHDALHNHFADTLLHDHCPRCNLNQYAPEVLRALQGFVDNQKEEHGEYISYDDCGGIEFCLYCIGVDAIKKAKEFNEIPF